MSLLSTGEQFGRLTVICESPRKNTRRQFSCRCECGRIKDVPYDSLKRGDSQSCGCLRSELASSRMTVHGHSARKSITPEYRSWTNMIARCTNPKCTYYEYYGGRGITVCDRWKSFPEFVADMGNKPSRRHTLERLDTNGNYSPGNCVWASRASQAKNKRSTKIVEYMGDRLCLTDMARKHGLRPLTLRYRLLHGWDIEKAITTKPNRKAATWQPAN